MAFPDQRAMEGTSGMAVASASGTEKPEQKGKLTAMQDSTVGFTARDIQRWAKAIGLEPALRIKMRSMRRI